MVSVRVCVSNSGVETQWRPMSIAVACSGIIQLPVLDHALDLLVYIHIVLTYGVRKSMYLSYDDNVSVFTADDFQI